MLKILSLNMRKALGASGFSNQLNELRSALQQLDLDVVILQELKGHSSGVQNQKEANQLEFLSDEVWPHFAYGQNAVYKGGHHGNAILSRWPILKSHNLDISTNEIENRGILWAEIEHPAFQKKFYVFCLHFNVFANGKERQRRYLKELVSNDHFQNQPLIIGGDFNDWSLQNHSVLKNSLGLKEVGKEKIGRHFKTFPSILPLASPDQLYFRGFELKESSTTEKLFSWYLSDHLGIYSQLEMGLEFKAK